MDEQEMMRNRPGDFALDEPLPLGAAEPMDVAQVRADDALIEALSSTDDLHIDDPIDERLAGLLRSWRKDVQAEPEPSVDVTAAMAAMAAPKPASRRQNLLNPLATAAAVLVVAFIGLGLGAHGAQPGDALWGVTKVLYSDKAKSVEAKVTVTRKLDEARQALDRRDPSAAKVLLDEAQQQLPVVAPEDGKQQLSTETERLIQEAKGSTAPIPTSTPSAAPTTTSTPVSSAPTQSSTPPPSTTTTVTTTPAPSSTTATSTSVAPTVTASLPGEGTPGGANASPKVGDGAPAVPNDPTAAGS